MILFLVWICVYTAYKYEMPFEIKLGVSIFNPLTPIHRWWKENIFEECILYAMRLPAHFNIVAHVVEKIKTFLFYYNDNLKLTTVLVNYHGQIVLFR